MSRKWTLAATWPEEESELDMIVLGGSWDRASQGRKEMAGKGG